MAYHKLSQLEKLNVLCNLKAKKLIRNEANHFIAFSFDLSLPYLTSWDKATIIKNPHALSTYIELQ